MSTTPNEPRSTVARHTAYLRQFWDKSKRPPNPVTILIPPLDGSWAAA
ncbi:hypothetical protein ACH41E_30210 [Streptomyces sp. NPDC020412]